MPAAKAPARAPKLTRPVPMVLIKLPPPPPAGRAWLVPEFGLTPLLMEASWLVNEVKSLEELGWEDEEEDGNENAEILSEEEITNADTQQQEIKINFIYKEKGE